MRLRLFLVASAIFIPEVFGKNKNFTLRKGDISKEGSLERQFEKHFGKPDYPVPYPLRTSNTFSPKKIFIACKELYTIFPQAFLKVLKKDAETFRVLNRPDAFLLLSFYIGMFDRTGFMQLVCRCAYSLCFYTSVTASSRTQCLQYATAMIGPVDFNCGQRGERCIPWLLIRTLLIKVDLYPMDELKDWKSVCNMVLLGFSRIRRMEHQATRKSDYDEEFLLIFQETLYFFGQFARKEQRDSEAKLFSMFQAQLRETDLFRKVSPNGRELRWERSLIKQSTTVKDEIQRTKWLNIKIVFYFTIIFCIMRFFCLV